MKLTYDVGLALGTALIAYFITEVSCSHRRHLESARSQDGDVSALAGGSGVSGVLYKVSRPARAATAAHRTDAPDMVERALTPQQRDAENMLRNAVIVAASESMAKRNVRLETCFGSTPIVDTLKLRFAVDVSSDLRGGITKAWRFDRLIDGQALPPSFAACAAETFGRDHRLLPSVGGEFPTFDGEISIVYTLTRPPMDAAEADAVVPQSL